MSVVEGMIKANGEQRSGRWRISYRQMANSGPVDGEYNYPILIGTAPATAASDA
jgi:hypothetical protein